MTSFIYLFISIKKWTPKFYNMVIAINITNIKRNIYVTCFPYNFMKIKVIENKFNLKKRKEKRKGRSSY